MREKNVTIEMVRMARQQLIDNGEVSSDRKIKKLIGFGSPNTINRFNRQLREEELRDQLARELEFPSEIRTAFVTTLSKRVAEETADVTVSLREAEECLKDTVTKLTGAEGRIESLEAELANAQGEKNALAESLAKQNNEGDISAAELAATIAERTATLKAIIRERETLQDQVRELTKDTAKLSEATRMQREEADSLREKFHTLEQEMHAEKTKAAVAERECSLLRDNLEEKNSQLRDQTQETKELRAHVHQLQTDRNQSNEKPQKPSQSQNKGKVATPDQ